MNFKHNTKFTFHVNLRQHKKHSEKQQKQLLSTASPSPSTRKCFDMQCNAELLSLCLHLILVYGADQQVLLHRVELKYLTRTNVFYQDNQNSTGYTHIYLQCSWLNRLFYSMLINTLCVYFMASIYIYESSIAFASECERILYIHAHAYRIMCFVQPKAPSMRWAYTQFSWIYSLEEIFGIWNKNVPKNDPNMLRREVAKKKMKRKWLHNETSELWQRMFSLTSWKVPEHTFHITRFGLLCHLAEM